VAAHFIGDLFPTTHDGRILNLGSISSMIQTELHWDFFDSVFSWGKTVVPALEFEANSIWWCAGRAIRDTCARARLAVAAPSWTSGKGVELKSSYKSDGVTLGC
jgi:hypothetical protein